jgi:hypothetical protein
LVNVKNERRTPEMVKNKNPAHGGCAGRKILYEPVYSNKQAEFEGTSAAPIVNFN